MKRKMLATIPAGQNHQGERLPLMIPTIKAPTSPRSMSPAETWASTARAVTNFLTVVSDRKRVSGDGFYSRIALDESAKMKIAEVS